MNRRKFLGRLGAFGGFSLPCMGQLKAASLTQKPVLLQTSPIAGFQYYDGKQAWKQIRPGVILHLQRENNIHDKRAVAVWLGQSKLGYVPRRDNATISQLLDNGAMLSARIIRVKDPECWEPLEFAITGEANSFPCHP